MQVSRLFDASKSLAVVAFRASGAVIGRTGNGVLVVTFGMSRDEPNPENAFSGTCLS